MSIAEIGFFNDNRILKSAVVINAAADGISHC